MKIRDNRGTERVVDLLRPWLQPACQLDLVTPSFSLFAFGAVREAASKLAGARILLPPDEADLGLHGEEADRAARNRLQTRWLAGHCADWLDGKAELRRGKTMSTREDAKGAKKMNVEEASAVVVDAAFHVHKELGPGLLESVYEAVLARALERRGLSVQRQKSVSFEYDGMRFDEGLRVDNHTSFASSRLRVNRQSGDGLCRS